MNWVGGVRSRLRQQKEKKQQKEYFERQRYVKKVQRVSGKDPERIGGMSQDLMSLHTISKIHSKKDASIKSMSKPVTKVDFGQFRKNGPATSFGRKIENVDLPDLSPCRKQSSIQLMDTKTSETGCKKRIDPHWKKHDIWQTEKNAEPMVTPTNQMLTSHRNKDHLSALRSHERLFMGSLSSSDQVASTQQQNVGSECETPFLPYSRPGPKVSFLSKYSCESVKSTHRMTKNAQVTEMGCGGVHGERKQDMQDTRQRNKRTLDIFIAEDFQTTPIKKYRKMKEEILPTTEKKLLHHTGEKDLTWKYLVDDKVFNRMQQRTTPDVASKPGVTTRIPLGKFPVDDSTDYNSLSLNLDKDPREASIVPAFPDAAGNPEGSKTESALIQALLPNTKVEESVSCRDAIEKEQAMRCHKYSSNIGEKSKPIYQQRLAQLLSGGETRVTSSPKSHASAQRQSQNQRQTLQCQGIGKKQLPRTFPKQVPNTVQLPLSVTGELENIKKKLQDKDPIQEQTVIYDGAKLLQLRNTTVRYGGWEDTNQDTPKHQDMVNSMHDSSRLTDSIHLIDSIDDAISLEVENECEDPLEGLTESRIVHKENVGMDRSGKCDQDKKKPLLFPAQADPHKDQQRCKISDIHFDAISDQDQTNLSGVDAQLDKKDGIQQGLRARCDLEGIALMMDMMLDHICNNADKTDKTLQISSAWPNTNVSVNNTGLLTLNPHNRIIGNEKTAISYQEYNTNASQKINIKCKEIDETHKNKDYTHIPGVQMDDKEHMSNSETIKSLHWAQLQDIGSLNKTDANQKADTKICEMQQSTSKTKHNYENTSLKQFEKKEKFNDSSDKLEIEKSDSIHLERKNKNENLIDNILINRDERSSTGVKFMTLINADKIVSEYKSSNVDIPLTQVSAECVDRIEEQLRLPSRIHVTTKPNYTKEKKCASVLDQGKTSDIVDSDVLLSPINSCSNVEYVSPCRMTATQSFQCDNEKKSTYALKEIILGDLRKDTANTSSYKPISPTIQTGPFKELQNNEEINKNEGINILEPFVDTNANVLDQSLKANETMDYEEDICKLENKINRLDQQCKLTPKLSIGTTQSTKSIKKTYEMRPVDLVQANKMTVELSRNESVNHAYESKKSSINCIAENVGEDNNILKYGNRLHEMHARCSQCSTHSNTRHCLNITDKGYSGSETVRSICGVDSLESRGEIISEARAGKVMSPQGDTIAPQTIVGQSPCSGQSLQAISLMNTLQQSGASERPTNDLGSSNHDAIVRSMMNSMLDTITVKCMWQRAHNLSGIHFTSGNNKQGKMPDGLHKEAKVAINIDSSECELKEQHSKSEISHGSTSIDQGINCNILALPSVSQSIQTDLETVQNVMQKKSHLSENRICCDSATSPIKWSTCDSYSQTKYILMSDRSVNTEDSIIINTPAQETVKSRSDQTKEQNQNNILNVGHNSLLNSLQAIRAKLAYTITRRKESTSTESSHATQSNIESGILNDKNTSNISSTSYTQEKGVLDMQ